MFLSAQVVLVGWLVGCLIGGSVRGDGMGWDGGGDPISEIDGTAVSSTLLFYFSIDSLCCCGWLVGWLVVVHDEMGILVEVY